MIEDTPLDAAHRAMTEAPEDDAARLRFYARLADSELCLILTEEARGGSLSPEIFEVEGGRFVLAFDREDRLSAFAERPAPYAALPGRALAALLAPQKLGLALNPEVAPSAMLLPADAVAWLATTLEAAPEADEARPVEVFAPGALPPALVEALDAKLARAGGLARGAYLSGVRYETGQRGHLLALVDARPGAEPALARAVQDALVFSGLEAGALDVTFLSAADPLAPRIAAVAWRIELPAPDPAPEPEPEPGRAPRAPGSDPDRPPRLR